MNMSQCEKLCAVLGGRSAVYIQTHNFPDHDAIASAFALRYLLEKKGITSTIIYAGQVQRLSLKQLMDVLEIPALPEDACPRSERDKIIIVDGCKGNKNVVDLVGDEVAVIDHHDVVSPDDVKHVDIRPAYGACSTIMFEYLRDEDMEIPRAVASALLTGLLVDTALMTRGVCRADLEAYAALYVRADVPMVNALLRNKIQQKELSFYRYVIEHVRVRNRFAFCYFSQGCNQNLLGIIGDFLLSLSEVDFVFLCARNNGTINFSVRSEVPRWNAAFIVQEVLQGLGFGGGHSDMAGGMIEDYSLFCEPEILARLQKTLKEEKI
jgi:nanoRNase/pAp phosphatase (c-di-AMP/oligoRNAs hydrolase)